MEKRPCSARMTIYFPVDPSIQRAFVIIENPHNHPAYAKTKATTQDKKLVSDAIEAAGVVGLTAGKLNRAQTTLQLCNGLSLSCASGVFMDRRLVREAIQKAKHERFPKGLEWEGVHHEFEVHQKALPKEERYIHSFTSHDEFRVTVTMHPGLIKFVHSVNHLQIDYTFKRVHGEFNEWKIVGFLPNLNRRVTFATLYCDRATTEAFETLFTECFRCVERITGQALKFSVFFPDSDDAKLLAILVDAEIAQVLGLGQSLLVYLAKYVPADEKPEGLPGTAIGLALLVLKLCYVHFIRNIEKLKGELSDEDRARLKGYRNLATSEEIEEWHAFCRSFTTPGAIAWYQQKAPVNRDGSPAANAWILKAVNKHVSPMPTKHWDATPDHTNLVEGSHAQRNATTGIRLPLLEAILTGKADDDATLQEIQKCLEEGVLPKRFNGVGEREKQGHARKRHTRKKAAARKDRQEGLDHLTAERDATKALIEQSRSRQQHAATEAARLRKLNKVAKDAKIRAEIKTLEDVSAQEIGTQRDLRAETRELEESIRALKKRSLPAVQTHSREPGEEESREQGGEMVGVGVVGPLDVAEGAGLDFDSPHLAVPTSIPQFPMASGADTPGPTMLDDDIPHSAHSDAAGAMQYSPLQLFDDFMDLGTPFSLDTVPAVGEPLAGATYFQTNPGLGEAMPSLWPGQVWGAYADSNDIPPDPSNLNNNDGSGSFGNMDYLSTPFLNPFGVYQATEDNGPGQLILPAPSTASQDSVIGSSTAVGLPPSSVGTSNGATLNTEAGPVATSTLDQPQRPQRKRKQANMGLPVVPSEYKGDSKQRTNLRDRWYMGVAVAKKAVPGGTEC
ncbi:hypothetical protein BKA70DRAFT_70344 [Coprinopsis sp. MPI-PUGE-AT-0042]|nr:hypothetical protein BKA70DRAFT_70344 [Coprinopsis sp. MPI-PUGE-AT-0042]